MAEKEKNYYDVLGVGKNATKDDIKKAYKNMAKKFHPDLNKNDPSSEGKFKEVNEAYSTLSDDQKRSAYDQFGKSGAQGFSGGNYGGANYGGAGYDFEGFNFGGEGFSDIFDSFFGGRSRRKRGTARGSDLEYELDITLEDAYAGGKKNIIIPRHETCNHCHGSGAESSSDIETCETCGGAGVVARQQRTPFGIVQTTSACPNCNGAGKVISKFCHQCKGKGKNKVEKNIDVNLPRGIDSGNRLRVRGEGEAGERGGQSGDLYILINILTHDVFSREGDDLNLEIPISFTQAAVGDSIEVPTIDGTAKLHIPAGTDSGTLFKMKGKGMPSLDDPAECGEEYVKVNVETPKKLTKEQKDLLIKFDESLKENPYKRFFEKVKSFVK